MIRLLNLTLSFYSRFLNLSIIWANFLFPGRSWKSGMPSLVQEYWIWERKVQGGRNKAGTLWQIWISGTTQSWSDMLHFHRQLLLTTTVVDWSNYSLLNVFESTVILILEYLSGRRCWQDEGGSLNAGSHLSTCTSTKLSTKAQDEKVNQLWCLQIFISNVVLSEQVSAIWSLMILVKR